MRPITLKLVFTYIYTIVGWASHGIVCHTRTLKHILTHEYRVPENKVAMIAPVIPQHRILKLPIRPYFLYYGYMVRRKGIEHLIDAMSAVVKRHPKFSLILAGGVIPGQEQALEELKQKISQLNLHKHIHIQGYIAQETDLDTLYAEAYAVVIPAHISIAASGPLYHARGYGKCIIASGTGHLAEEIQDGENGILTKNEGWAAAMMSVIEQPELARRLENGSRKKTEEHDNAATADSYYKWYRHYI